MASRWWIGAGLLGAGGLLLLLAHRRRPRVAPLVLVQDGDAAGIHQIQEVGELVGGLLGVRPYLVETAGDLSAALGTVAKASPIVFVGHGTTGSLFSGLVPGAMSLEDFAVTLIPHLPRNFVLSLNACRTGADPDEIDWSTTETGVRVEPYVSGGARSFAARLRDALVAFGAPRGEIRAHAMTGIHGNPSGRVFPVSPAAIGTPGTSLREIKWGGWGSDLEWGSKVRRELAYLWITGGDFDLEPMG